MTDYVEVINDNGGIKFNLITGSLKIDQPGNYVLATGCGSGKTSAIIDLIKKQKDKGIIYSAKTIEECETMYEYLCDCGLKDEILLLHSSSTDNKLYINQPTYIRKYKIVICTHHKLMNTPSEVMLTYTDSEVDIPPHMRYWITHPPYQIRKYILVDEMIEKPGFTTYVEKSLIASIKLAVDTGLINKSKYGYSYSDIEKYYNNYAKVLHPATLRGIDEYKLEYTLSLISEHLDEYVKALKDEKEYIEISYTLLDLLPGRRVEDRTNDFPYFFIFDGTGDIYYRRSKELIVKTVPNRYKSSININTIPFDLNRYEDQEYDNVVNCLSTLANRLKDIIRSHNKTLIVTWMNLKSELTYDVDDVRFNIDEFSYIDELSKQLMHVCEKDGIDCNRYNIIHYQSGSDRATNEFIDSDCIVFIGDHKVHTTAIVKSNKYNRTRLTQLDYQVQMIVQAICRTQIRLHDPNLTTDVFFSSDWSNKLIDYVDKYINGNKSVDEIFNSQNSDKWIDYVKPTFRDRFTLLNDYFHDAIKIQINIPDEERDELNLFIYKHELVNMIPISGSFNHYDPLLYHLHDFRIRLTIGIPISRYIKVSKDGKLLPYTIYQEEILDYLKSGYKIETKFKEYFI